MTELRYQVEFAFALMSAALIAAAYLVPGLAIYFFIAAYLIGGYAKAREGFLDVIHNRHLNVELLMILAAIGAALIGYWTEGAILILIFALSGAMESYTMKKSERDLAGLMRLQPNEATRVRGEQHEVVAVTELAVGDQVLVKPGERIPIDGEVLQGSSSVDESAITGESNAVDKGEGDDLFAGTMNGGGSIILVVTKASEDTLFQKIIRLVEQAQQEVTPAQQFIKRFEQKYVVMVLATTLVMFFLPHYAFGWEWEETFYRALVLLVVASPCALVASISPAVLSVLSYGARNGVLIKGGGYVERLANVKVVAMDKTGTITTGEPHVTEVFVHEDLEEAEFLKMIAGLEGMSNHPLAKAIVREVLARDLVPIEFDSIQDVPGKGITGRRGELEWAVGSARFVGQDEAEAFVQERVAAREAVDAGAGHGAAAGAAGTFDGAGYGTDDPIKSKSWTGSDIDAKTVIYMRDQHRILGAIALQDVVRQEAHEAIHWLKDKGIHVVMITGDQESVAALISQQAEIEEWMADALPDEKLQMVKDLRAKYGAIMMIGDGINDAPSLARADVGVAMGGGTDVAMDTADMVLVKNNLMKVSEMIRVSRKMNRIVKQNIVFSLAVISLLIVSNYMQLLTLPLGVIGHEGSTILVILNGLRLLRG